MPMTALNMAKFYFSQANIFRCAGKTRNCPSSGATNALDKIFDITIFFKLAIKTVFFHTMASTGFGCPYCGRDDFKSSVGLTQHQNSDPQCKAKRRARFGVKFGPNLAQDFCKLATSFLDTNTRKHGVLQMPDRQSAPNDIGNTNIGGTFAPETVSTNQFSNGSLDATQFYDFEDDLSVASGELSIESDSQLEDVDEGILKDFKDYVATARNNVSEFTEYEHLAITLLDKLRKSSASPSMFEEIMLWHSRSTGALGQRQMTTFIKHRWKVHNVCLFVR